MLPSQFAIEKKVISWMLVLIFGVGGMAAFFSLGQLEDPPFTIKDAKILVAYPGASPQQVEEEVTFPVEQALQQLNDQDRMVVWLHDVEGYKHREIAKLVGKTESYSKTRLNRARAKLRELITETGQSKPLTATLNATA